MLKEWKTMILKKRKQNDIFIPVNGIYKIDNINIQILDYVLNDYDIAKINYKTNLLCN